MATRSDFYGDAVVSHYIDSLRRNVSSSPDYESWEYTESPYFNRQTDDWTSYPVKERIFAGVMSDPALAALYSKFYTAPGETVTSRDYYGTATKDQGDNSFLSDMADPLKFAAMAAGLGFGGSALFGSGAAGGGAGFGGLLDTALPAEMFSGGGFGGLLDTALPAEMFGGSGAAGAAGGGGLGDFFYGDYTGEAWIDDMLNNLSGNGFSSTTANPSTWLSGVTGDASWMQPNGLQKLFMDMGIDPSKLTGNVGSSLLRSLFTGSGGANSGSYSFPFADVLKGVLEYSGQKDYQSELLRLMDKSIEYSDPFRTQRPRYFEPLYDAATKGIGGTPYGESIANSTLRKLSSTGDAGYDISGLGANTLAKNLNSASMDYVKNIAPLAGAQFGGNASQSITSMGPAAAGAGLAAQGGLGAAFEAANRGSQPSALEQLFGQQKNQNLGQALFSF